MLGLFLLASLANGQTLPAYRSEPGPVAAAAIRARFSDAQIGILEKLNRADRDHLPGLATLMVPERWDEDELIYAPLPARYPPGAALAKMLVLHLPGQMFGAYESGRLVRWGPVSSGSRRSPTPHGLFYLNWRSRGHRSSVDPDWFMPWYFNIDNVAGRALHQYALPGRPASHGCVRLLERDAQWLYGWGEEWTLDRTGTRVVRPGTPVFIVGGYQFDALPPWQSPEWLAQLVELPSPFDE
jgi:hypothetical protein